MASAEVETTETQDSLLEGKLTLWQPARGHGYRFNLDPVLLSGFCPAGADRVLELGAGCGVLGLHLLKTAKAQRLTAVERQAQLVALIERNAAENGLASRVDVHAGDLRRYHCSRRYDLVVFNPPYFKDGSGRPSPDLGRDLGRYERHGTLGDFFACARRHLAPSGHVCAIVPMHRADDALESVAAQGLHVQRRQDVLPRAGARAKYLLLAATGAAPTGGRPHIEPPLIVHGADGQYTQGVVRLLNAPGAVSH